MLKPATCGVELPSAQLVSYPDPLGGLKGHLGSRLVPNMIHIVCNLEILLYASGNSEIRVTVMGITCVSSPEQFLVL